MPHINESQFRERFVSLILSGRELPKKQLERHVLLISSILKLTPGRRYSEGELNEVLRSWATRFGSPFGLDHVTLRRYLIDEHYITRDAAGSSYERLGEGLPFSFDPAIESLDMEALIVEAREERERRRRLHTGDEKR